MKTNAFEILSAQTTQLPLLAKQVLYAQLRTDLEVAFSKSTLEAFGPDDILQLWVPRLTTQGRRHLDQSRGQSASDFPLVRLLDLVTYDKPIIHICILNYWTLEQCSILLREAIDQSLLHEPHSVIIDATISYLANKTRLGEFLVKIGKLTTDQLDQGLRTQQYILTAMGEKTGIANVLINLGYITQQDTESILFLKQESRGLLFDATALQHLQSGPKDQPEDLEKTKKQLHQAISYIRRLEEQLQILNQNKQNF
jgi:hypothetical protein